MADKKISELSTASVINNSDNIELSQDTGNGLVSLKATILALATKILTNINFTNILTTDSKTITGAINEIAESGGGGGVDWVSNGFLGAKNLNSYPYYETSNVDSGITWTVNSDGTVKATGKATAQTTLYCHNRVHPSTNELFLPNGNYILSV